MKKTILVTGASSGIGKSIAQYFISKGWNVAATMRNPSNEKELEETDSLKLYSLDVINEESIMSAIENVISDFGKIDVLVNNAGYGAIGIFEKSTQKEIQKQFDVNVFGVMQTTKAILPHMRANKSGTIINITSVGGRLTFPIYSVYNATKWAVEGFAESLQYEVKPFGIRIKNVEPGAIKTDFYSRSQNLFENKEITAYDNYEQVVFKNTQQAGAEAPDPEIVAKTVYKAANDASYRIRYLTGNTQSKMLMKMRKLLPLTTFMNLVSGAVTKGLKK